MLKKASFSHTPHRVSTKECPYHPDDCIVKRILAAQGSELHAASLPRTNEFVVVPSTDLAELVAIMDGFAAASLAGGH
jgi:hypothetical protein